MERVEYVIFWIVCKILVLIGISSVIEWYSKLYCCYEKVLIVEEICKNVEMRV